MKTILRFSLLVFLLIELASVNSFSQTLEERAKHQIDSVNAARTKLSKAEQKISTPIYKMLADYESAIGVGKTNAEAFHAFNRFSVKTDKYGRIYINVWLLPTNPDKGSVEAAITKNGGVIHSLDTYTIVCWLPVDAIRTIATLPSVTMIEQVHPAMTR